MSRITLPFENLRLRVGAFMLVLLSALSSIAQTENVGIGTTKPDNSALLDLSSSSKGLLIPRMTLAQRGGIQNPATGLLVYQIDFFTGFYFFDGLTWKSLYARTIDGAALTSESVTSTNSGGSWAIGGNSGLNADINFLGTSDTTSLVFKVNNYRSGLLDHRFGNTYFGYRAGYRSQGFNSIAIGAYALHDYNLGLNNIAIGYQSLLKSQTGSNNVALGANALYSNVTGSQNIGIGTQAGQRSLGDGNIFIGFKAGVNEIGDNKLYIDNNLKDSPLIYGDFEKGYVGINTQKPESALSIDSKTINISGLEFKQLNSNSPAGKSNQKVLSLDSKGRVILVQDSVGTGSGISSAPTYWALKGNAIENSNVGDVVVGNLRFKNLRTISPAVKSNGKVLTVDDNGLLVLARDSVGASIPSYWGLNGSNLSNTNSGKVTLNGPIQFTNIRASNTAFRPYGKVLSVDDNGNLILVRDSVGVVTETPTIVPSTWTISGNDIVNSNLGKAYINNGLSVKSGINIESGNLVTNGSVTNRSGLVLNQLKLSFPASKPSGKVLSVDDNGNVILVRDSVGVAGTVVNAPSPWTISGDNISNANTGTVAINALTLPKLSSNNTPTITTPKVLSVDDNGNVILVNTPTVGAPPTTELWKANADGMISNNNTQGVLITANSDGLSGLRFAKLNASSATGNRYGKVLSVDGSGNVVLVNDGLDGNNTGAGWTITDGRLQNSNNGKVVIGTGINSFPGDFQLYVKGGILTERVRVAVANSNSWADYVFENGYKLMPLRDVEKHINYYHHLPNVPSAEQMVKSGMDIMETSAKLLEKIEELTLYMIKANKQIEALESKLSNLEKMQK